ncbi:MAG: hypothetical protein AUJ96_31440 [Armatimonadetes bacterium CG2_30_66_41]|nr:MAG: hypothetical protein AUJ96_31440 [Armatimonadetes bacterium CG2_30_66_41]
MSRRTLLTLAAAVLSGAASLSGAFAAERSPVHVAAEPAKAVRLGTFQKLDLITAYYRSDAFARRLAVLQVQREAAVLLANKAEVERIEKQGAAMQELAHKQLAGQASATEVIDYLKPYFPEVAKAAGVHVIVDEVLFRDSAVQLVEVTDLLMQKLPPARHSPETR